MSKLSSAFPSPDRVPVLGIGRTQPAVEDLRSYFSYEPYLESLRRILSGVQATLFRDNFPLIAFLRPSDASSFVRYAEQTVGDIEVCFTQEPPAFPSPSSRPDYPVHKKRPRTFRIQAKPDTSTPFTASAVQSGIEELDFLSQLRLALRFFHDQRDSLVHECETFQRQIDALQDEIDGLRAQIRTFPPKESGRRTSAQGAEVGRLTEQVNAKETSRLELASRRDNHKKQIRALERHLRTFAERAHALFDARGEMDRLNALVEELNQSLQSIQQQIDALGDHPDPEQSKPFLRQQEQVKFQLRDVEQDQRRVTRKPKRFSDDPPLKALLGEARLPDSNGLVAEIRDIFRQPQEHVIAVRYSLGRVLNDHRLALGFGALLLGAAALAGYAAHRQQVAQVVGGEAGVCDPNTDEGRKVAILQGAIRRIDQLKQRQDALVRSSDDCDTYNSEWDALQDEIMKEAEAVKPLLAESYASSGSELGLWKARLLTEPAFIEQLGFMRVLELIQIDTLEAFRSELHHSLSNDVSDLPTPPNDVR